MNEYLAGIDALDHNEEINNQERLVVPGNVKTIKSGAIKNADSLREIIFEDGVQEIQNSAITSCVRLERVVFPKTIQRIGKGNLEDCDNIREISVQTEGEKTVFWAEDGVLYCKDHDGKSELFYYPPGKEDTLYRFPKDIRCGFAGEGYPFTGCAALTTLQIPGRWIGGTVSRLSQLLDRNDSIRELYIESEEFTDTISSDAIQLCQKLDLSLAFQAGGERFAINANDIDLGDLQITGLGKDVPLAQIRAIQSLENGDMKYFAAWACDALKRKKETSVLINLMHKYEVGNDTYNDVSKTFLSRTGKKGIKKAEAENYANLCLQCSNTLEVGNIKDFYEQCREKEFENIIQSLEKDPRFKQMESQEDASEKNEVEAFVFENYRQTEDIKLLSEFDLTTVKYKDTDKPVPDYVVQFVIASYMSQLEKMPKHIGGYRKDYIEFAIDEEADKVAASFDRVSFMETLNKLSTLKCKLNDMKIIAGIARYADADWIRWLRTQCNYWGDWYKFGPAGRAAIIVAHGAIMLNDTKEAIAFTDKLGNLGYYAEMRGMKTEVVRNKVLADVGLDGTGSKQYFYGNTQVRVSLNGDMKLDIYNLTKDKSVKSFPKDSSDEWAYQAANQDFKQLKRDIREVVKNQKSVAFLEFLSGQTHKTEDWKSAYLGNYLLQRFAELLVWKHVNGNQVLFFTLKGDQMINMNDQLVQVEKGEISVAHPIEMDPQEVKAWQTFFMNKNRKQPFEQIWEPVCVNDVEPDRYTGIILSYNDFSYREKDGIRIEDYDFHNDITIRFDDCDADVYRDNWSRHNTDGDFEIKYFRPQKTRRANHVTAYLDRITTIGRIEKDDVSALDDLDRFTIAQISSFIDICNKGKCVNCLAVLLDQKNRMIDGESVDVLSEFTLED